jgi:hypothetical protein
MLAEPSPHYPAQPLGVLPPKRMIPSAPNSLPILPSFCGTGTPFPPESISSVGHQRAATITPEANLQAKVIRAPRTVIGQACAIKFAGGGDRAGLEGLLLENALLLLSIS